MTEPSSRSPKLFKFVSNIELRKTMRSLMVEIFQFVPKRDVEAAENLSEFIRRCRDELTVFGADLIWTSDYWETPGISFGNLDQKTRLLDPAKVMRPPFIDFAKAYFRYQQGHRPTKSHVELRALRCLERALLEVQGVADLARLNTLVLDQAAILAKRLFSFGTAYQIGRELSRLGTFVSENYYLIATRLDWKNPIARPMDTIRTGIKA